jgi:hypothetical protein
VTTLDEFSQIEIFSLWTILLNLLKFALIWGNYFNLKLFCYIWQNTDWATFWANLFDSIWSHWKVVQPNMALRFKVASPDSKNTGNVNFI